MQILYVGNFDLPYRTERYVTCALEMLGHTVHTCVQTKLDEASTREAISQTAWDFVLFSKTQSNQVQSLIEALKGVGILTVCWQWDLYKIPIRPEFPVEYACDLVFSSDGSHHDSLCAQGIYHKVLRQGIHKPEAEMMPSNLQHPVLFVGHGNVKSQTSRGELLDWLKHTYGKHFTHARNVRGTELNKLLGRSGVVVGDSYPTSDGGYWSNRIYEITGRGGFLLHPETAGLEEEYQVGVHYDTYVRGDWDGLRNKIDYYLAQDRRRCQLKHAGFVHTRDNYTYEHRCKSLIEAIQTHITQGM